MPKREDDFSPATVKNLAARVNHKCSDPSCRAPTSGPHSDSTKSVNVGNAAHITAASPGGARYDENLTSEQRKHADNGIWLCATHATEIDRDATRFTVELLQEWKRDAEAEARATIGKTQTQPDLADSSSLIASQQATISSQQKVIQRLTLDTKFEVNDENSFDLKWHNDLERALKWSEAGQLNKVQAAQEIITEIRLDEEFEKSSDSFQSRVATASAVCAVNMGDKKIADKEVREAFRLQPENITCLSNMAGVAIMRDEFERAATLAEKVREKEPENENAALVLVQAYYHLNKAEQVDNFLKSNAWFLELPNGCAVVAQIRSNANRFDEAIHFAERALKQDKKNVQALEVLYDALFSPLRERVLNSEEWDFSIRTKRRLQRAEAAITRAILILEASPDKDRLHRALSNRAAVRSSQGKTELAFLDIDRILNDKPSEDNFDTANLNKSCILIHIGRAAEALPYLQLIKTTRWKEEADFALAYSYHIAGQSNKALEIWESLWNPEECDALQMMTASLMLWVHRQTKNDAGAEQVLERAQLACPENIEVQYLIAQDKYDCGDLDGAIKLLKAIVNNCREKGDNAGCARMLSRLGDILYRSNQIEDAVTAWREVGWERLLPPYRNAFLNGLYQVGNIEEVLNVARSIRRQVGFTPRAVEMEAVVHAYTGDYSTACQLWEELARREPKNYLHNINRAQAALTSEDHAQAKIALEAIYYEDIRTDADALRRVSSMQAELGMKSAIRFAFRARQIDFGNPDSHTNYVNVFLNSTNYHSRDKSGREDNGRAANVLGLNGPRWGEVPCTIRLLPIGETDERKYRAVTVLSEAPFDQARGVYPPSHSLAKQLLKIRSSDETITLKDSLIEAEQKYQVLEILSPYVHAFQESMIRSEEWFGEDARVWSIDVREGLDNFWKFMDAVGEGFQEFLKQYKEWVFPLHTIASCHNRSIFDLWFFVSKQGSIGIHAERGNPEFFEKNVKTLEEQQHKITLCLDSTALIAINHFDLIDILKGYFKFLVPQSLSREIRNLATGILPTDVPTDLPDKMLSFIENHTQVLSAKAIIQFAPKDIQDWQKALGQADLDAALLALEYNALFYSDDAVMREAVKFHPGVQSTGTHIIADYLFRQGSIQKDEYYFCLETLSLANYRCLLLSRDFFMWLLEKHNFSTNKSVRHALRFLEGKMCTDESAIGISAWIIAAIWNKEPQHKRRFEVLGEILLSLSTDRLAMLTIQNLCRLLAHPQLGLRQNGRWREILYCVANWQANVFR